jgi:hypothetical protein
MSERQSFEAWWVKKHEADPNSKKWRVLADLDWEVWRASTARSARRPLVSADAERGPPELVAALRAYEQADEDGVMVLVSRQACEEAAALLESPLYSADTIAALRKDALLLYGKVRHEFYRMGFPFMTEAEIDRRMAEQWPAAHASWMALKDAPVDAAIDAAQSAEGER